MSRVIGHPQPQPHVPYASAYYRPAVDRGEYTLHSPGNYMAFPVYPPQHHVHPSHLPYPSNGVVPNGGMGTTTTVYPSRRSRSRSNTHQDKASRSSSRSRPDESNGGSSHGHSVSDFFSLRRSRSQDSRKSAKSTRSGISSKSLGEVVGEVFEHMMNPFKRSKSRDRVYTRGEYLQEGSDWYLPSRSGAGNRLVKSQSTRRPARVPTYESAPAPGHHLHRSNTTSNIPHHILHQERHRQRDREADRERDVEREGRSRSRTRAFTQAELEDQATTRRGLQDWIDNRMQDKDHSLQQVNGNAKIQTFQPTWRASKDYRQNNHTTSLGGVPVSTKPLAPLSAKGGSKAATAAPPNSSYTTTYKYNGYNIRV